MSINFPNSPQVGDTFLQGSILWKWNGLKWEASVVNLYELSYDSSLKTLYFDNDGDVTDIIFPFANNQELLLLDSNLDLTVTDLGVEENVRQDIVSVNNSKISSGWKGINGGLATLEQNDSSKIVQEKLTTLILDELNILNYTDEIDQNNKVNIPVSQNLTSLDIEGTTLKYLDEDQILNDIELPFQDYLFVDSNSDLNKVVEGVSSFVSTSVENVLTSENLDNLIYDSVRDVLYLNQSYSPDSNLITNEPFVSYFGIRNQYKGVESPIIEEKIDFFGKNPHSGPLVENPRVFLYQIEGGDRYVSEDQIFEKYITVTGHDRAVWTRTIESNLSSNYPDPTINEILLKNEHVTNFSWNYESNSSELIFSNENYRSGISNQNVTVMTGRIKNLYMDENQQNLVFEDESGNQNIINLPENIITQLYLDSNDNLVYIDENSEMTQMDASQFEVLTSMYLTDLQSTQYTIGGVNFNADYDPNYWTGRHFDVYMTRPRRLVYFHENYDESLAINNVRNRPNFIDLTLNAPVEERDFSQGDDSSLGDLWYDVSDIEFSGQLKIKKSEGWVPVAITASLDTLDSGQPLFTIDSHGSYYVNYPIDVQVGNVSVQNDSEIYLDKDFFIKFYDDNYETNVRVQDASFSDPDKTSSLVYEKNRIDDEGIFFAKNQSCKQYYAGTNQTIDLTKKNIFIDVSSGKFEGNLSSGLYKGQEINFFINGGTVIQDGQYSQDYDSAGSPSSPEFLGFGSNSTVPVINLGSSITLNSNVHGTKNPVSEGYAYILSYENDLTWSFYTPANSTATVNELLFTDSFDTVSNGDTEYANMDKVQNPYNLYVTYPYDSNTGGTSPQTFSVNIDKGTLLEGQDLNIGVRIDTSSVNWYSFESGHIQAVLQNYPATLLPRNGTVPWNTTYDVNNTNVLQHGFFKKYYYTGILGGHFDSSGNYVYENQNNFPNVDGESVELGQTSPDSIRAKWVYTENSWIKPPASPSEYSETKTDSKWGLFELRNIGWQNGSDHTSSDGAIKTLIKPEYIDVSPISYKCVWDGSSWVISNGTLI